MGRTKAAHAGQHYVEGRATEFHLACSLPVSAYDRAQELLRAELIFHIRVRVNLFRMNSL